MTDNLVFWSGVLLGVAGIATGLVTYWLARKPKYIDYEVKASQRILAAKESDRLDSKLRVVWTDEADADEVLSAPEVHTIRIKNTGKSAVASEDFVDPLTITMPQDIRALEASVIAVSHHTVLELVTVPVGREEANPIVLKPRLLNPGDWLEVRLVTDKPTDPEVSGELSARKSRLDVEAWAESRRAAELSTSSRVAVSCWIKGQSRAIRRSDLEVNTLIWELMPRLSLRRLGAVVAGAISALVISVAIFGGVSILSATGRIVTFVITVVIVVGLFVAVLTIPISLFGWLLKRIALSILRPIAVRRRSPAKRG